MTIAVDRALPAKAVAATERGQLRFWVVPHTHWDREWYLPFEHFRMRLARCVDEILDVLEQDACFSHFTLDGQAVILEDYLEVRPEQEARLRALIAAGRIAVGPCYILPDEYLVGQESLVRNLLLGRQVCQRYGARPMAVGYLPDTFGHVAQLPQILRGFGLESFVFWRGLGDEAEDLGAVFTWQGPDGSQVLAVRQLDGYGSANELGRWTHGSGSVHGDAAAWPETAARRVTEFLERHGRQLDLAGLQEVLLCNGTDHQWIQRDLPQMLAACQERLPGTDFRIATYEACVDAIRERVGALTTYQGELCGGREAPVLRGVNSARMYLKQANEATERELFMAEALAALAQLRANYGQQRDFHYPLTELRVAWRELLRNQPHDSICGCSVDEVHRDMLQRYQTAQHIAGRVRREALTALAGARAAWSYVEPASDTFSVVNVLPWAGARAVELPLPATLQRASGLIAETAEGQVPVQLEGPVGQRRAVVALTVPGLRARQVRLMPGRGAALLRQAQDEREERAWSSGQRAIENQFYRVEAAADGTVSLTERRSGRVWTGLHVFQDQADRGDEYNFCPLEGETLWDSRGGAARVRVRAHGPAVAELQVDLVARLPRALTADRRARTGSRVACPIRTAVRLVAGVERVEVRTTVTNRALDHRLRVLFPAPEADDTVRVEGHFAVLRRPARPVWSGQQWSEPPANTHHTLGMVAAGKLALFTRGLPEYEAIPRSGGGLDLALTLLRSVGWLSREDLLTRPGHAGPELPTPEAQCVGQYTFEYAISLQGEADDAGLVRAAQNYRTDLAVGPGGAETFGALSIEGEGFALAALKGAEDGQGLVLRLYNPGHAPAEAQVHGVFSSVQRCRLDEMEAAPGEARVVSLQGGEIVTLRLR